MTGLRFPAPHRPPARDKGVFVLVIADTHRCPALKFASAQVIAPSKTPHFFASYGASLVFVETLIGLSAQSAGMALQGRIAEVDLNNRRLQEVLSG